MLLACLPAAPHAAAHRYRALRAFAIWRRAKRILITESVRLAREQEASQVASFMEASCSVFTGAVLGSSEIGRGEQSLPPALPTQRLQAVQEGPQSVHKV